MNAYEAIPFLDLVTPHVELEQELTEVFKRALHTASFIGGPLVEQFERAFADFCGVNYCVGASNGTDALRFALTAAGVKPGDVAITVPNTFIATVEAISQAGAETRFVDVDERTYNMDPAKVREYLEKSCTVDGQVGAVIDNKTGKPVTAIVPVHLYGQTADMDALLEIAKQYNLILIEDACQAHGAEYFSKKENRWRTAGSMGRAAAFSFYPGKNLGACGEGGAVTTNDESLAKKVSMLRDHGQSKKYYHDIEGYNGRLDPSRHSIRETQTSRGMEREARGSRPALRQTTVERGRSGEALQPGLGASSSSPVCSSRSRSRRVAAASVRSQDWDRNPLPCATALAKGLCRIGIWPWGLSGDGENCARDRIVTDVSAAQRRAARAGCRANRRLLTEHESGASWRSPCSSVT